jgi:thioredoxin 1
MSTEKRILEFKTRSEFKNFVSSQKIVVVKLTATWCGPCKRSQPLVDKCFKNMPNNVYMVVVDIDKSPDIKRYLKCTSVPTFVNFVDGEMMDTIVGGNEDGIISFFKKTAKRA